MNSGRFLFWINFTFALIIFKLRRSRRKDVPSHHILSSFSIERSYNILCSLVNSVSRCLFFLTYLMFCSCVDFFGSKKKTVGFSKLYLIIHVSCFSSFFRFLLQTWLWNSWKVWQWLWLILVTLKVSLLNPYTFFVSPYCYFLLIVLIMTLFL